MIPQVRYQVFVSSTYEDLRGERQQATQAILEAGCFPSGMELFPASDDTQWELIKRVSRTCRKYSSASELGMAVMKSLMTEARIRPRTGWVRADQARSDEDIQRERKLLEGLAEANETIKELERKIRDRAILTDELLPDRLAQGDDVFELTATYSDRNKGLVSEKV
jgi:hypothetical protein